MIPGIQLIWTTDFQDALTRMARDKDKAVMGQANKRPGGIRCVTRWAAPSSFWDARQRQAIPSGKRKRSNVAGFRGIAFCFGRMTTAHWLELRASRTKGCCQLSD